MWHAVWSPAPRGNKGFSERDRAKLAALETAETLDLGPWASGYRTKKRDKKARNGGAVCELGVR